MTSNFEADPNSNRAVIDALKNAVAAAPGNVALVKSLVDLLITLRLFDEAERTLRTALSRHRGSHELQLMLAKVYLRDGRDSHAIAIIETLVAGSDPNPSALVMHARLLQRSGEPSKAVATYRHAIELDDQVAEPELESLLGIEGIRSDDDDQPPRIPQPAAWQDEEDDLPIVQSTRPTEGFDSVGGMQNVKEDIRVKIIYPLEHAELYAAYGKKIGGGILLYGPPGCGKTHLARATAGEIRSEFITVGINDVLDMWIGNSEKNLHALFEQARRQKPCVLFFDEVDALGASRSDMKRSGGRQLINQFLQELDGVDSDNDGLLCLAATNTPWSIDAAFRRPGRFDRIIFVPPPDTAARVEILKIQLRGKPTEEIDLEKIAAKTPDFSGADLGAVVDSVIEAKLGEAVRTGRPKPITTKDLLSAAKSTRCSTQEWFATARNHALYANEGGLYDEILHYLKIKS